MSGARACCERSEPGSHLEPGSEPAETPPSRPIRIVPCASATPMRSDSDFEDAGQVSPDSTASGSLRSQTRLRPHESVGSAVACKRSGPTPTPRLRPPALVRVDPTVLRRPGLKLTDRAVTLSVAMLL